MNDVRTARHRPKPRSGLVVFGVFFGVFAFCAAVVVWLVTQPFRDLASRSAERAAATRAGAERAPAHRAAADRRADPAPEKQIVLASLGAPGTGPGQFEDVRGIAVDGAGRLYASDFIRTGRIQVFDAEGTFLAQWLVSEHYPVSGLAATRDAALYVVQRGEITKYDGSTGKRLSKVAYARGFHDVAVLPDGGFVAYGWFAGQDRLVSFDANGRVTRQVSGVLGSQMNEVLLDGQVAVDGQGRTWVLTGLETPTILQFSRAGTLAGRIPSGTARPQQFSGSAEIAVDPAGRLLVTGREGVQVWSTEGRHLETLPVDGQPRDLAIAGASAAWVSTSTQKLVKLALPK
jgi:hypothetical protein